eukprot:11864-Pleurochrysis_carterae.AAC.1
MPRTSGNLRSGQIRTHNVFSLTRYAFGDKSNVYMLDEKQFRAKSDLLAASPAAKGAVLRRGAGPPAPHCSGVHLGVASVRLALGQRRLIYAHSVHRAISAVWLLGGYPSYHVRRGARIPTVASPPPRPVATFALPVLPGDGGWVRKASGRLAWLRRHCAIVASKETPRHVANRCLSVDR